MTTEPWWTCHSCGYPICRVGRGKGGDAWERHRTEDGCPNLGGKIVQWDQGELRFARDILRRSRK